ncbi:homoserine kinase [Sedimentibacter hydroxybenzoicus DSM 7310]|uniref:Homoserine kinase n=1 Tax=Sedimentibacter hydroxybenzoicus DSM 7310 TaxID=1123245 RepID=A0A974BJ84_SEDHY|nr:homoserine kinase [Sedimentibacter hydroxybenzoicus]NYB74265.1 homoserine kinase [Sedimentibacter hydroxybenzoicus DSM 7310]
MVKVTVPATTANLGPGFDTLGLALNLYNTYTFEEINEGLVFEGCPDKYKNIENLVYQSFAKTAKLLGKNLEKNSYGLKITMDTHIPVSRGLGSSSACIVGGVFGANALLKGNLSKDELFKIAVEIEGHPDNVAPAVYGGLTAAIVENGVYSVKYSISDKIKFCALIPDFETSTHEARKILPSIVSFKDAIFNVSRTAVLLKALEEGNFELISVSLKDMLHQQYRKTLISEYDEVKKICLENGSHAFFISGSGPTLMNITNDPDFIKNMENSTRYLKNKWDIKFLNADRSGVIIK